MSQALDDKLRKSAASGDIGEIRSLVAKGVSVNSADQHGVRAIHRAATIGYFDCIQLLTELKANVRCTDNNGKNILHYCCHGGDAKFNRNKIMEFVTDTHSATDFVNYVSHDGETPLMTAALWCIGDGFVGECVQLLLEKGARTDIITRPQRYPNGFDIFQLESIIGRFQPDVMEMIEKARKFECRDETI